MVSKRLGEGVLALTAGVLCFCLIGCPAAPAERSVYDLSLDELREERARLRRETRDIRTLYLTDGDPRRELIFEITLLRAVQEIHDRIGPLPMPKQAPVKPVLALPRDPLQLTIVQRQTKAIQGSDETIAVHVGDVTGGQVLVEVLPPSGPTLVDTISMKPGDVVKFQVAEKVYHLTLVELQNFLFGDDVAMFEVSTNPPSAERIRALRKAAQPPEDPKSAQPPDPADRAGPDKAGR